MLGRCDEGVDGGRYISVEMRFVESIVLPPCLFLRCLLGLFLVTLGMRTGLLERTGLDERIGLEERMGLDERRGLAGRLMAGCGGLRSGVLALS